MHACTTRFSAVVCHASHSAVVTHHSQISTSTIPSIVEFVTVCSSLTKIVISHVQLTSRAVGSLCTALAAYASVKHVDFSNNIIGVPKLTFCLFYTLTVLYPLL